MLPDEQIDDTVLKLWRAQYPLPAEEDSRALKEKKHLYRPPRSDLRGILVASTVIGCWAALFCHAMWGMKMPWAVAPGETASSWLHIAVVFFSLEFLYTGLFITTHDAMHGTIALRNRKLNDFMGWLAISLYAWFDYGMLHRKHWEHHNHTGVPHEDPDFHKGNPNLLVWFGQFMLSYATPLQFLKIFAWSTSLQLLGVPIANQMVFMTAAPLLSAFRLFYYGTYVPHHPPAGHLGAMPWQVSRSSTAPRLQSFLTCYHFDMHWEHHRWPYAPWWELPTCRDLLRGQQAARAPPAAGGAGERTAAVSGGAAATTGEAHAQPQSLRRSASGGSSSSRGGAAAAAAGTAAAVAVAGAVAGAEGMKGAGEGVRKRAGGGGVVEAVCRELEPAGALVR